MDICTRDHGAQPGVNAERPDDESTQTYAEKSTVDSLSDDAAREATRLYVERVDRYLARPDVIRAERNAAPSFLS